MLGRDTRAQLLVFGVSNSALRSLLTKLLKLRFRYTQLLKQLRRPQPGGSGVRQPARICAARATPLLCIEGNCVNTNPGDHGQKARNNLRAYSHRTYRPSYVSHGHCPTRKGSLCWSFEFQDGGDTDQGEEAPLSGSWKPLSGSCKPRACGGEVRGGLPYGCACIDFVAQSTLPNGGSPYGYRSLSRKPVGP